MTLNASGPISLGGATAGQSINLELGQAATAVASINATNFRTLAGVASGQISLSNFYGKSSGPSPGDAYQGGYFAGKISVSGSTYALVVAPRSTGRSFLVWKTTATSTSGTSSTIDGPTNSANMNNASHPAAQFCEGLTIGGYTDWYMPARDELEVLYYFLKPNTTANNTSSGANAYAVSPEPVSTNYTSGSPAQTNATIFRTGGAQAFNGGGADSYWTSTQYNAANAYYQDIGLGGEQSPFGAKQFELWVIAIRRVLL